MRLLTSKNSIDERPDPVWFVIERETYGTTLASRESRTEAVDDFRFRVAGAYHNGEGYTPFQRGRRVSVIGPNVYDLAPEDDAVRAVPGDEDEDPPLHPDVALRVVLDPDEYRYVVHGPLASALLES